MGGQGKGITWGQLSCRALGLIHEGDLPSSRAVCPMPAVPGVPLGAPPTKPRRSPSHNFRLFLSLVQILPHSYLSFYTDSIALPSLNVHAHVYCTFSPCIKMILLSLHCSFHHDRAAPSPGHHSSHPSAGAPGANAGCV